MVDRGTVPSGLHEGLLTMVDDTPSLLTSMVEASVEMALPADVVVERVDPGAEVPIPTQHRADRVWLLRSPGKAPSLAVVMELQRRIQPAKRKVWPLYLAHVAVRHGCPAMLLVVSPDEETAAWSGAPIAIGPGSFVTPFSFGPGEIGDLCAPDRPSAEDAPRWAAFDLLLRAPHLVDPRPVLELVPALATLGPDRAAVYFNLIRGALARGVRNALEVEMRTSNNIDLGPFLNTVRASGHEEGREEGERRSRSVLKEAIVRLADARGIGLLPEDLDRLATTDVDGLGRLLERAVTATTREQLFDDRPRAGIEQ